jgi:hypothetical protein
VAIKESEDVGFMEVAVFSTFHFGLDVGFASLRSLPPPLYIHSNRHSLLG